jgi:EAL domain-containing protein (putative c-di-GMP-specific phosphodiesterase class I)
MSDADEAASTLRHLKGQGVRLSVDDFGTGYSSLTYLKRFPLDALKIDRAFISDIGTGTDGTTIPLAIIRLAHSLGLTVVAEGVETQAQYSFLKAHGCDEMQGYYFARPMPISECTQWLIEGRGLR